jgi:DNA-binding Lrp family transcriptional regulator
MSEVEKEIYNYLQRNGQTPTSEILKNINSKDLTRMELLKVLENYEHVMKENTEWNLVKSQRPGGY